jgi:hypothetical protein
MYYGRALGANAPARDARGNIFEYTARRPSEEAAHEEGRQRPVGRCSIKLNGACMYTDYRWGISF